MKREIWERFNYRSMARDLEREIAAIERRISRLRAGSCDLMNAGARLYLLEDELCDLHITRKLLLKKAEREERQGAL